MNSNCPGCGNRWTIKSFAKGICPKCGHERNVDLTILGRQKEGIEHLIKEGKLHEAYAALNILNEFWHKYNYGFMYTELRNKIREIWKGQEQ